MAGLQLCFGEFSAPSSKLDKAVRLNRLTPASFLSLSSDFLRQSSTSVLFQLPSVASTAWRFGCAHLSCSADH